MILQLKGVDVEKMLGGSFLNTVVDVIINTVWIIVSPLILSTLYTLDGVLRTGGISAVTWLIGRINYPISGVT